MFHLNDILCALCIFFPVLCNDLISLKSYFYFIFFILFYFIFYFFIYFFFSYFIAPHSYIPPGSGLGTRRLTLKYHFLKIYYTFSSVLFNSCLHPS